MRRLERCLRELEKLQLPLRKYVISGSGPLAVRGIRDIRDLDVVVTEDVWQELSKKYEVKNGRIQIGCIEIFKDWPVDLEDLSKEIIEDIEWIDGFPYARLCYIILHKKRRCWPKDVVDLSLLMEYFNRVY